MVGCPVLSWGRDPHGRVNGTAASPTSTPAVHATPSGGGWLLEGAELVVPHVHLAERIVVPAQTVGGGVLLALVDPRADGASMERAVTTNREVDPHLVLANVAVGAEDVLVGPDMGRPTLDFLLVAATIGLCALQVGVCEAAIDQTAAYTAGTSSASRSARSRAPAAGRGRLHRHRGDAGHVAPGGMALRHGLRRGQEVRVAKWLAAEGGQKVGAPLPAPARRHGLGHRLPDPPLLPVGRAERDHARAGSAQLARLGVSSPSEP